MKRASLKSIAAQAGVSKTTASFVLNGKGCQHKISPATQERILEVAKQQHYQPSFLAQTLSSGITHTVGFLWNQEQAGALLLPLLADALEKARCRLLPGRTRTLHDTTALVEDFILRQCDAVIAFDDAEAGKWIKKLQEKQIPYLLLPTLGEPSGFANAPTERHQLFNLLLKHHFEHHRKAIGFIGLANSAPETAESFRACYLHRFGMSKHLVQQLTETSELPKKLHKLADLQVRAVIFENSTLLSEALSYLKTNPYTTINNMTFSTLGWAPGFEWAHPPVSAADFDYDQLAGTITDWIENNAGQNQVPFELKMNYRIYP